MSDIPAQLGPNTLAELVTALNGPGGAKRRRSLAGIDSGRALADALTAAQPRVSDPAAFEEFVQTVRLFDGLPSGQDAIRGLCTAIAESPADVGISLVPTSTGDYRLDVTDTTSTRLLSVAVPAGRWCRIDTAAPG